MAKTDIYYIEVVGKALDILDVFVQADVPLLTLQQISTMAGLNKNVVFRVLYTLAEHGYVVKQGHDYELGSKLRDLGSARLRRRDLLTVTSPYLDALRDRFGETVNLGVLDAGRMRYVDVRESRHRFRLAERIGGADFVHCTALGKAWLAHMPFEEVKKLLKQHGMPCQTVHTITTLRELKAELDAVRRAGYAVDREESMEGAYCVGAPVLDGDGMPLAAVSIAGPTTRMSAARVPEVSRALLDATGGIRQKLGYE